MADDRRYPARERPWDERRLDELINDVKDQIRTLNEMGVRLAVLESKITMAAFIAGGVAGAAVEVAIGLLHHAF